MKKSNEIIGLPVISITEGRELGMSKTLLIDAKNRRIAAITIEDEDWYRGVKLIPYDSVIAIGSDAVTVTSSETIIKLDEAADFENLLDENIRIIGTKAITKAGTIEGSVTEIYIGDDGTIERCEVTGADGATTEVTIEQISIFGKQVTVIDSGDLPEKKNSGVTPTAPTPAPAPKAEPPKMPEAKPETPAPEPKVEAPAAELPKVEEPKAEEEKKEEPAIDVPAVELPKTEEPKKEEAKVEAPKVEVPKVELPKAEEPKKEEAKDAPKTDAPKADAPKTDAKPAAPAPNAKPMDKAQEDRHRRFLLGKKATRKIEMDNGIVIVDAGAEITEEVLQKAKLANKFTELAMNAQ